MTTPGFLAIQSDAGATVELANNARTLAYLQKGLGGPQFEAVTGSPCPDLTTEAWPLTACVAGPTGDQFYSSPLATYVNPATGLPVGAQMLWREAGYLDPTASFGGQNGDLVLPDLASVVEQVTLAIDLPRGDPQANGPQIGILRFQNASIGGGAAGVQGIGAGISWANGVGWNFLIYRQTQNTNNQVAFVGTIGTGILSGRVYLRVAFTAQGFTCGVYLTDPDFGAAPILSGSYGYSLSTAISDTWISLGNTQSEVAVFGSATRTGILTAAVAGGGVFVYTELDRAAPPCVQTGDLYPSDTLWPSDDLYPALYGVFLDPGMDNAPWVDIDRPEGFGYLGLLVDDIAGLDGTSTRTIDAAADGIGGILGPETLDPRQITVTGWMIANGCNAMEYARRWLEDTLAGSFCAGCTSTGLIVRTTCGDEPSFNTNRWILYDVGLTSFVTDLNGGDICCFVTPVTITLAAADPFLYGPVVNSVPATLLNPGGSDSAAVPFETWLFGQGTQVCATVADQGIGIDAPIFTFLGGTSGIEAGLAYQSMGLWPNDSIFPGDCITPADGLDPETNDSCPFVFDLSIGPGEIFVVDNSRRKLKWILADGTTMDGSPKLNLQTGDAIEWIDSCQGTAISACAVAYAGCTCDDTALVQIDTQHRER
jgi:hypothetical protein